MYSYTCVTTVITHKRRKKASELEIRRGEESPPDKKTWASEVGRPIRRIVM